MEHHALGRVRGWAWGDLGSGGNGEWSSESHLDPPRVSNLLEGGLGPERSGTRVQGRGLVWSGGLEATGACGEGVFSQSLQLGAWGCCSGLSPGGGGTCGPRAPVCPQNLSGNLAHPGMPQRPPHLLQLLGGLLPPALCCCLPERLVCATRLGHHKSS